VQAHRVRVALACGAFAVALGGCGVDAAGFGAPSATFPAVRMQLPRVVYTGGFVMTDVHVAPIYFATDPEQPAIDSFLAAFASSPHWHEMVGEYGVDGPLQIDPARVVATAPPVNDEELDALIKSQLGGEVPAAFDRTIYVLVFPGAASYSGVQGTSCVDYLGFHTNVYVHMKTAIVAAVWSCTPRNLTLRPIDSATVVISHELVEAATDPVVQSGEANRGFATVDAGSFAWAKAYGAEIGDMCAAFPRRLYRPDDVGFLIQRTWSNAQMAGFHDPCVPHVPHDVAFFATVPDDPDVVPIHPSYNDDRARATIVAAGDSHTIDLLFLSDGPTDREWTVAPFDQDTLEGRATALDFAVDRNSGENGTRAHLTITARPKASPGFHAYRLESSLGVSAVEPYRTAWFGTAYVPGPVDPGGLHGDARDGREVETAAWRRSRGAAPVHDGCPDLP
jgi:hypothetical protein